MSCNTCGKKSIKKLSAGLMEKESNGTIIELFNQINVFYEQHWNTLKLINYHEIKLLPHDLVNAMKEMIKILDYSLWEQLLLLKPDDNKVSHMMGIMVSCGILKIPEHSWLWKIPVGCSNYSLAHWAAANGKLNFPLDSNLWRINSGYKGDTPAHWAVFNLGVPYDSEIWWVTNYKKETPAHYAALYGKLDAPHDSPLWIISDKDNETPIDKHPQKWVALSFVDEKLLVSYLESKEDIPLPQNVSKMGFLGIIRVMSYLNKIGKRAIHPSRTLVRLQESDKTIAFLSSRTQVILKNMLHMPVVSYVNKEKKWSKHYIHCLSNILVLLYREDPANFGIYIQQIVDDHTPSASTVVDRLVKSKQLSAIIKKTFEIDRDASCDIMKHISALLD